MSTWLIPNCSNDVNENIKTALYFYSPIHTIFTIRKQTQPSIRSITKNS